MSYQFRPAVRDETSLLIGIAGASGSGKTFTALRLARGLVGENGRIAMIDTEAGRALHYADTFDFDHCDLKPPFRPEVYLGAIVDAEKAGYGAIIIDSTSHEWSGDGGVLDWQEEELQRMAGDDWKRRESCKMAAWIKPKMAHKKQISRLLQCRVHLIFCLRAEEKMEMRQVTEGGKKKTVIVPKGWQPICEKNFMYEMTCSFMLTDEAPGVGRPIKLQDQHRHAFPEGEKIGEAAGQALAEWARGGASKPAAADTADEATKIDFTVHLPNGATREPEDIETWERVVKKGVEQAPDHARLEQFINGNNEQFAALREAGFDDAVERILVAYGKRIAEAASQSGGPETHQPTEPQAQGETQ